MPILTPQSPMTCPHCAKSMEGVVDDYSIPGRVGRASRAVTECEWCDSSIAVEQTQDGFLVEMAAPPTEQ